MKADSYQTLERRIRRKTSRVGVVGVGFVGSTLVKLVSEAGFPTVAIDIDSEKIRTIRQEFPTITASTDFHYLETCDIVCICVPTPLNDVRKPDLSYYTSALTSVAGHLHRGQLVITESSVAPGTNRSLGLPILSGTGLLPEQDFYFGFSPERIDPGNSRFAIRDVPKVVSGLTEKSKHLVQVFYSSLFRTVIPVSTLETAELCKMYENVFRFINICFVNEMAAFAQASHVDIWELIDAASTKPYGFLPHYPGPGVGGDCIPVLTYHLLDNARSKGVSLRMVESAVQVNTAQPQVVVRNIMDLIGSNAASNGQNHHRVLLVGITYKPDIPDIRESAALTILELLKEQNITVDYHDPYVPAANGYRSVRLTDAVLADSDLVVITTPHTTLPYQRIVSQAPMVFDTSNVLSDNLGPRVHRLY